jgi:outer membrane protein TolC
MSAPASRFEMGNRKIVLGNYPGYLNWIALALVLLLAIGPIAAAQSPRVLTLEQAVEFALKNYPAVRASLERVNAAQAGVGLARTSYLPRADMLWQTNRATDNNATDAIRPGQQVKTGSSHS